MVIDEERIKQIAQTLDVPTEQLGHFLRAWKSEAHAFYINSYPLDEVTSSIKPLLYGGLNPPRTFPVLKRRELVAGDWVGVIDPKRPGITISGKLLGFDEDGIAAVKENERFTLHADVNEIMFVTRDMVRYMVMD